MEQKLKKTLISSALCIGIVATMSGCGKRALPNHISNTTYNQKATLYAPYSVSQNSFVNQITNKQPKYAMRLNDYAPIGFNTRVYSFGGLQGVLWATPNDPATVFETHECLNKPSHVFIENIVMAPFTIGIPLLAGGGWCKYHHVFEFEEFDEAAKDWLEDEGIDRKLLIDKYAKLLEKNAKAKATLSQEEKSIDTTLNNITQSYISSYQTKAPNIVIKYNDVSGFYKGEKLNSLVSLKYNKIESAHLNVTKDYSTLVNKVFPCKANKECTNNMNSTLVMIDNDVKSSLSKAKKELEKVKSTHVKYLQKQVETLNVDADYTEYSFNNKHKTLYYHLSKLPKKIRTNTKQLTAVYNISRADFQNIFPKYEYEDNNLKVSFDPESKRFTITNKTEQFIEIGSASLYYNGSIYNLGNNSNSNFLNEFSPNGVKTFDVIPTITEANYKSVTKKALHSKRIKFGFAFKYTTLQPHQQHTLYKVNSYNLVDLLNQY